MLEQQNREDCQNSYSMPNRMLDSITWALESKSACFACLATHLSTRGLACSISTLLTNIGNSTVIRQFPRESSRCTCLCAVGQVFQRRNDQKKPRSRHSPKVRTLVQRVCTTTKKETLMHSKSRRGRSKKCYIQNWRQMYSAICIIILIS